MDFDLLVLGKNMLTNNQNEMIFNKVLDYILNDSDWFTDIWYSFTNDVEANMDTGYYCTHGYHQTSIIHKIVNDRQTVYGLAKCDISDPLDSIFSFPGNPIDIKTFVD